MARRDKFSNKKPLFGNLRSHALNATRRRFNLNVQSVTLWIGGKKTKIRTTAKTLRTLRKRNFMSLH